MDDDLLDEVSEVLAMCSQFWTCNELETVDMILFNLEKINQDITEFCNTEENDDNLSSLQQCVSQLIVHWQTKLSHLEVRHRGRPKKTINIELVSQYYVSVATV